MILRRREYREEAVDLSQDGLRNERMDVEYKYDVIVSNQCIRV